ncbi:MAG: type II toxin-antitoxin system Phd/YefM family antitoxin [Sedimentisphaeraceae bacterium JB056]
MDTMTYSAARADFAKTIDRVCSDRNPVIIRKKKEAVVMMSLEDYESWAETIYLLRSPQNAERLIDSIKSLEDNGGVEKSLESILDGKS